MVVVSAVSELVKKVVAAFIAIIKALPSHLEVRSALSSTTLLSGVYFFFQLLLIVS